MGDELECTIVCNRGQATELYRRLAHRESTTGLFSSRYTGGGQFLISFPQFDWYDVEWMLDEIEKERKDAAEKKKTPPPPPPLVHTIEVKK